MRSARKSWARTGSSPWAIIARTRVGLMPKMVTAWSSRKAHKRSVSGKSGAPSNRQTVAPLARVPTISHGPMIQPKSANQNRRSPGRQSNWNATSSAIFTVNPPCTCTEPFGLPVVPEV